MTIHYMRRSLGTKWNVNQDIDKAIKAANGESSLGTKWNVNRLSEQANITKQYGSLGTKWNVNSSISDELSNLNAVL